MKKIGKQTFKFNNPISIIDTSSTVGPVEGKGPLIDYFDLIYTDDTCQEKSYEKAEHKFCLNNINNLLKKENLKSNDIDILIGGDLLNQIITTNLTARDLNIPFWGVYNACATFVSSMQIASVLIDGGFINKAINCATSHFSTAERQYRFPLEQGTQSPPTAQRTVTGSGACLLTNEKKAPYITYMSVGKVVDYGENNANDMGSAMAAAAYETIVAHFEDTKIDETKYDLIITGDLGKLGHSITKDLLLNRDLKINNNFKDCGMIIYDLSKEGLTNGGSGAGCSASVFSSYIYKEMKLGNINKVLLVATGALLSPTSTMQKETIPSIAHAITIENFPSL